MQRKDCNKKSSKKIKEKKTNFFHVFCDRCETHTHRNTRKKTKKINKSKRVQRPKVKIISDSDATPHEAMRNDDDGQPSRAEPSTVERYVCGVSVSVSVWLLGSKMY